MPRTREQVAQAAREKAVMRAINRCSFELDLDSDLKMSYFLRTPYSTFRFHMRERCQGMKLRDFAEMARRLGFTGREVCEMLGVPYEDQAERTA